MKCRNNCSNSPDCGRYDEYGCKVIGAFRKQTKPRCPFVAAIPTITVVDKSGMKGLADCLVHVVNINTTYYIDDKHRIITVWAGSVEQPGYDYKTNPLGLRGQTLFDFTNNRGVYYDKTGAYRLFTLTDDSETN